MRDDDLDATPAAAPDDGGSVPPARPRGRRAAAERGISFSAPMVLALLAGVKTQTRRLIKDKNVGSALRDGPASKCCPFRVGDRLWVREAYRLPDSVDALNPSDAGAHLRSGDALASPPIRFEADGTARNWPASAAAVAAGKRRMGMFMPRWAARILLDIVDVRMERLSACSPADAIDEGIERLDDQDGAPRWRVYGAAGGATPDPLASYRSLWEQINGAGSWAADPWVWVVEFRPMMAAA
jgi:hypothetical protein